MANIPQGNFILKDGNMEQRKGIPSAKKATPKLSSKGTTVKAGITRAKNTGTNQPKR